MFEHVRKSGGGDRGDLRFGGLVQDTSKMKKSTTGAKVKATDRSGHGALR